MILYSLKRTSLKKEVEQGQLKLGRTARLTQSLDNRRVAKSRRRRGHLRRCVDVVWWRPGLGVRWRLWCRDGVR